MLSYTADEMMTVTAARSLRDGMTCFVGIGLPSEAANLARATHAPDLVLIYESGTIGSKPGRGAAVDRRRHPGRDRGRGRQRAGDLQLLAAAGPDRHRLPGRRPARPVRQHQHDRDRRRATTARPSGCRAQAARRRSRPHARKWSWCCASPDGRSPSGWTSSRRSGSAHGPGSRQRLGLTGGGPQLVITDLGVLRPDPDTLELVLTGIYPGVSLAQVRDNTGWDLAVSAGPDRHPAAVGGRARALRDLLPRHCRRRAAAASRQPRRSPIPSRKEPRHDRERSAGRVRRAGAAALPGRPSASIRRWTRRPTSRRGCARRISRCCRCRSG